MSDLDAKLAETRELLDYSKRDGLTIEEVARIGLDLVGRLQAVLAMPEKKAEEGYFLDQRGWGYNQALKDIRATIEGKVGK